MGNASVTVPLNVWCPTRTARPSAAAAVSRHIRGRTNTLPLHIEVVYNEYQHQAAFACSSLLVALALVTLVAKAIVESRSERERTREVDRGDRE